jgi:hypothetical protein
MNTTLRSVGLDDLTITDEASFSHVAVYAQLKRALRHAGHRFYVPADGSALSWDRAVFLNLTFWNGPEGADVLCDTTVLADELAHMAWHHLSASNLQGNSTAEALFFAESIASAFDLYLVGRLLRNVPDSAFIETQVPMMSEAAQESGVSESEFAALLEEVVDDPERAFEDLRRLLFDVTSALHACRNATTAYDVLAGFDGQRFACLLHHYQLSTWVLYARAYATAADEQDNAVHALDSTLRAAPVALDWLIEHWLQA